jgi:hypothetical protein
VIWLVRIPILVFALLLANVVATFEREQFLNRFELDLSALLELGLHGSGTVIWLIAIAVSMLAFVPAVIAVVLADRRQIKSLTQYAVGGAGINIASYYAFKAIMALTIGFLDSPRPLLEVLCMGGGGALAGAIYWMVVGRPYRRMAATA